MLYDTFDAVASTVAFVPILVPEAVERGVQPVGCIDEKEGVVDAVLLAEFVEEDSG
ncbi:hypothetical protein [Halovivax sp.]|uniref:hypothetical protein n=1 Tax=Halovivax sp. TaxID=1935978 RepID=UPI0025C6024A|nr:hypothetical protein [Halovivax sp.]